MKKKVLFSITNLIGGGAEKILLDTVKAMDKTKYDVHVFSLLNEGIYIEEIKKYATYFYAFNLEVYPERLRNYIRFLFLRYIKFTKKEKLYKKYIHGEYDYEIAFLEGPVTKLIAGSKLKTRKYAWVHVDLIKLPDSNKYYRSKEEATECYNSYHKILCVSSDVKTSFLKIYDMDKEKVQVQLNVLDTNKILNSIKDVTEYKEQTPLNLITVGRLSPQKGYDRLLKCCVRLKEDNLPFKLKIVGTGLLKDTYQRFIDDHKLNDYVELTGFIDNPYPLLKEADLFVCSSLTEGFSTVVSEAIFLGTPVLTTDCAGMKDILGDSEFGLIVENNENGLYEGLKQLLMDKDKLNELREKAVERSPFFDLQARLYEFDCLFEKGNEYE
ncbi:glycosyltransferase [[Clostridium] innocuum]|uniref:glycosyltransferase n=1 Tax=Clostridium innocuum TaxID=1522 RepID=UPI0032D4513E